MRLIECSQHGKRVPKAASWAREESLITRAVQLIKRRENHASIEEEEGERLSTFSFSPAPLTSKYFLYVNVRMNKERERTR